MKHICKVLLLLLFLLAAAAGAAGEESHTLFLRCDGGGIAGNPRSGILEIPLLPRNTFRDAEGQEWTVEQLKSLRGFRVESAFLRFSVSGLQGRKQKYALSCGEAVSRPLPVYRGRTLWDVTAPVAAWLEEESPEAKPVIHAVSAKAGRWMETEERSACLQITFSAEEALPFFPLDRVEEATLLDFALRCLEENHPVLRHYDELSGSLAAAEWPLGVPYYFGGVNADKILRRFYPRQSSNYYRQDRLYICGLDCSGFINMVLQESRLEPVEISAVLNAEQGSLLLNGSDPASWSRFLMPGDLIAMTHGDFNHVVMYLGTLRTFGWDERTAGEAGSVLDLPLVIHCGENPFYYERYRQYILDQGYDNTWPPDGGVTVSVLLPRGRNAPRAETAPWGETYGWYSLEGTPLMVLSLEDCGSLAWYGTR